MTNQQQLRNAVTVGLEHTTPPSVVSQGIQGQGSQQAYTPPMPALNRKSINPRLQKSTDEEFEDFYSNYRTQSADHSNL